MQMKLRAYQKQDFQALKTIVRETWHYDDFSSPKTAEKLAAVFLSSCLTNYTYSRVALLNEEVVGIVLVKDKAVHRCPISHRVQQLKCILSLFLSREGRQVAEIFKNVSGIDAQLLSEIEKDYPAELALFAVSPACRGKGIGKILFQSALNYLREQKRDEFYLFTDTSCNYGFYEHQGMTRKNEKTHTFQINGTEAVMHFFIYEMNLNKTILF